MSKASQPIQSKITVFHCINVLEADDLLQVPGTSTGHVQFIKLPCSSMVKDVFLMRAFEAGADVVLVLVCPEGACRYVEGNLRAAKRIQRVKALLDTIGVNGQRLDMLNIGNGDIPAVEKAIGEAFDLAIALGPNPAAGSRARTS